MTAHKRLVAVGGLLAATAMVISGCSSSPSKTSEPGAVNTAGLKGQTVNISGAFTGEQATAFQKDVSAWAEPLGLTVKYNGSSSFQTSIVTQVKGGQAPDVAIFPAPGVLKGLTSQGMVPLDELIDVKSATSDEAQGLPTIAQIGGKTYGLPYSINVKSLVWYNPAAFKADGYKVPTTDDELMALQKQIISDGKGSPWCVGDKDGWPMTDWLEEYVLRYGGLEGYNKWITHEVPFDSPLVQKAATKVSDTLFTPGAVNGGQTAITATPFSTAGNNLFVTGKDKGQCFMMRQGTFITGFFPKDIQAQIAKKDLTNVNAFPLPTPNDAATSGTLGGGDIVGAFKNNDAVKAVVTYLVGKDFGTHGYAKEWSSHLSPHNSFDTSQYASPFQIVAAKAVSDSKAFGFDASDQMPGAVGSGTEWTQLTAWAGGKQPLDQTLKNIDASWPR